MGAVVKIKHLALFALVFFLAAAGLYVRYAHGDSLPHAGGYTVKVEVPEAVGSAFHIGDGYFITASHVVGDNDKAKIITDMGAFRTVTVMWRDKELDIALLKVDDEINLDEVELSCAPPERGAVTIYGLPHGFDFMAMSATISQEELHDIGIKGGGKWRVLVIVSVDVVPGMSGGPVVNSDGYVVAVIVGTNDQLGFAVPSGEVCKLLPHI